MDAIDALMEATQGELGRRARPESTYRLQFHKGFTFKDAAALTEYLRGLGVTHLYASPYFQAAAGSTHGYDVINHNALNPELGTRADYDEWTTGLARAGMSHILDTVPNHVGVATNHNAWWNDVLRYGRASAHAAFFDITWEGSPRAQMRGKVLLPLLGGVYGEVLENGELQVKWEAEELVVGYYERRFPITPASLGGILEGMLARLPRESAAGAEIQEMLWTVRALEGESLREQAERIRQRLRETVSSEAAVHDALNAALADLNGKPGDARSFDALDALLNRQHYRLAYWRVASDEINYRRFFDINDLAALSMEREEVFEAVHGLVYALIEEGRLGGLRIDHPDGLFDPAQYFRRLQTKAFLLAAERVAQGDGPWKGVPAPEWRAEVEARLREHARRPPGGPQGLYVVVEKILAADEELPNTWPVDGTSGYDFLVRVNGLFVDAAGEEPLGRVYEEFIGRPRQYEELVYRNKRMMLETSLGSELQMLTSEADALAQRERRWQDFPHHVIREALREVIAAFPVYRSYVDDAGASELDRQHLDHAIREARQRNPQMEAGVFALVRALVLQEAPASFSAEDRHRQRRFAGKFQQLTAPVTAKGIEDTTFYQYHRLVSLNEVGGEPGRFGTAPESLHAYFQDRQARWPYALSSLSTHDTKRSEDVRARLHVLSELPDEWAERVSRWRELTRWLWPQEAPPLDPNDAYLLFQTLLGAWPLRGSEAGEEFVNRIQAYMTKALREAKVHTRWTAPNEAYERGVNAWVGAVATSTAFLEDFLPFQRRVARLGLANSMAQTVLRLTAPGVPDLYQGTELWDWSLVDPDNRRPVDYATRKHLLEELQEAALGSNRESLLRDMLEHADDGRVKLFLNWVLLTLRREHPGLFTRGTYVPLPVTGTHAHRVFAFARQENGRSAVVAVPRLVARLGAGAFPVGEVWEDTSIELPGGVGTLRDLLSGREMPGTSTIPVGQAFAVAPFAVLVG